jgi:hypothetical protein
MKNKPRREPHHLSFCWNAVDRRRIELLQKLHETGRQEIVRMAIKLLAEKEGVV